MTLDSIAAGTDTVMTKELIRLFKYAGCSPTACHACAKKICAGHTFKLLPHKRPAGVLTDEMCCVRCGEPELVKRDKREEDERDRARAERGRADYITRGVGYRGGYSRPSKAA